jgi:2-polyprenyl-3-methyl-5-hydroxy-6-metoxy-1,4-benzoquinol methylase
MLKKYLGCLEGKRILDIGCGTGNFLSICDDLNMETYGVDVSEYAMEEAKSNTKAKLYRIDISRNKLPFPSNYFDVIISFDVVEHLNNDSIFFKDSYRTLKKRGFLYFITPNGRQLSDYDSTHINLRKIKTWETLCENMKFNILESYLYKWFSPFPYLYTQKIIRLFNILRGDYIQQAVILAEKS